MLDDHDTAPRFTTATPFVEKSRPRAVFPDTRAPYMARDFDGRVMAEFTTAREARLQMQDAGATCEIVDADGIVMALVGQWHQGVPKRISARMILADAQNDRMRASAPHKHVASRDSDR